MSFPPHLNRPLLPPPGMPPQFAGFPSGTQMIPLHVGIMTPTSTVMMPSVQVISKPPIHKKEILRIKDNNENSGPTTTVFVGNISEKASDMLIRQLLAKCGIVLSWKRVQGASGKLQAFGFCEYKEPDSTLRALRLLHDLPIGEKNLLVKVDAKTKAQLDEWKANRKTENGNKKAEDADDEEEVLDEEIKQKDQIIKGAIDGLMREYAAELNAPSQDEDSQRRKRKREKKEEEEEACDSYTWTGSGKLLLNEREEHGYIYTLAGLTPWFCYAKEFETGKEVSDLKGNSRCLQQMFD